MRDKAKIRRRQRCPECGSLDVIKWGIRNGTQRLKCRNCKSLFSSRRKDISKSNRFPWFRKYIQLNFNTTLRAGEISYQRLELKNMSTEKIISIIRVSATNHDDTSLILTPRIDPSGQAYYINNVVVF